MVCGPLVGHLSIGVAAPLIIRRVAFYVQVIDNHFPSLGCTIVVEVVVSVHSVLWEIVFVERKSELELLLASEVEHLLVYPSALTAIAVDEVVHGGNAHLVVGQSENESCNKKTLLEGEHSIVDNKVFARSKVVIANGGMTV